MTDWTCRKCRDGLYPSPDGSGMIVCDCPVGQAKRRWLNQSPEERRAERKRRGREKKREERERVPF